MPARRLKRGIARVVDHRDGDPGEPQGRAFEDGGGLRKIDVPQRIPEQVLGRPADRTCDLNRGSDRPPIEGGALLVLPESVDTTSVLSPQHSHRAPSNRALL